MGKSREIEVESKKLTLKWGNRRKSEPKWVKSMEIGRAFRGKEKSEREAESEKRGRPRGRRQREKGEGEGRGRSREIRREDGKMMKGERCDDDEKGEETQRRRREKKQRARENKQI
ncbi:uncharacterized protein [Aristolochia californica]|uniref:uncharacterized protein n=1 Tax=Aristolochia californica TaxID=171875 RepID=UPI0035D6A20E